MAVNNTQIGAIRVEATLESGKFVDGAKKIRTEATTTEAHLKKSTAGMSAAGELTMAARREGGAWKFCAMTWTGDEPAA